MAAGAILGTGARLALGAAWPVVGTAFPWTTLVINVVGSVLVGLAAAVMERHPEPRPWTRPFVLTGVLGSFTTYSAFAVETNRLLVVRPLFAAVYVVATVAGGVGAAAAGLRLAEIRR